jgi:tetratricopeptide (TPR) repeat protein
MEQSKSDASNQLSGLLAAYGETEGVQPPEEATTDAQLKVLAFVIEDWIRNSPRGTVLDIGCGKGVLLAKIAQLKAFLENNNWAYLGAEHLTHHEFLLQLAATLRLHRRTEVISLEKLHASWVLEANTPQPLLIVLRNVLHEIDIKETARLFHLLQTHLTTDDLLLIQDLVVFPHAERGNVCWDVSCLEEVINKLGFSTSLVTEPSKSGAQWFSAKIRKTRSSAPLQLDAVTNLVGNGRLQQLTKWKSAEQLPLQYADTRARTVALVDFDLQKAALFQQLDDAKLLSVTQLATAPKPSPTDAIFLALSAYDISSLNRTPFQLPKILNFRDRKNSQDALEAFLSSAATVVLVRGGTSCGKTVMVSEVLSRRSHGRQPLHIDCQSANSVWPLIEQYLLGLGCACSLEVLRRDRDVRFADIVEPLANLIAKVARNTIVVFDHFERFIDPNGRMMDSETGQFVTSIASLPGAKIIITSRRNAQLEFLPATVTLGPEQPPVGRFPAGAAHTENLLDDYVDRATLGIDQYPQSLLAAIDRYPYLAVLAGKLLAQAGASVAEDPEILALIKLYLFDELTERIATPEARRAINLARLLRIPTPRELFINLAGHEATRAAEEIGLLYSVPDRYRKDLLTCAAVLRETTDSSEDGQELNHGTQESQELHIKIAREFAYISKETEGDPRWIRESHYHTIAAGDTEAISQFGSLYKGELFWAARTWFRRFREYGKALEALKAAESMGLSNYESRRMMAACLVRTGKRTEGDALYRELIREYPNQEGVKTSYVDSLIRIEAYEDALALLTEFHLALDGDNPWVTGQYGRAALGMRDYPAAVKAFRCQLRKCQVAEAIVYIRLAQAHFKHGQRQEAREVIEQGLKTHAHDVAINTLYCANLLQKRTEEDLEKAERRLLKMADDYPRNGYVLQLLIKTCSVLGDVTPAIDRLDRIGWAVEPAYLAVPVEIAACLAQKQFRRALDLIKKLSATTEYNQAIILKLYLAWANSENEDITKQRIAANAIVQTVPAEFQCNVPIMTMFAQLAKIAVNETLFHETVEIIGKANPTAAAKLNAEMEVSDDWDDFEPDLQR